MHGVLKLLKNVYGQKHAGRMWSQHLSQRVHTLGFKPSQIDVCVYH
jgi:hypothetical protein